LNIVIAGIGKMGLTLVDHLVKEGHNITCIDIDPKVVDNVVNVYDVFGIGGNGVSCNILKEAGIEKAQIFISTTHSDELNILNCMIAKKMGAINTIARVRNPEYAMQSSFMRNELGIGLMINPELETANEISRIIRTPSAAKIETFGKGRVELAEIKIERSNPLVDKTLSSLSKTFGVRVLICAVYRKDEVFIPTGDFIIREGDIVHITASHSEMSAFFKAIGVYKQRAKCVIIVGGSRIAYYLAKQLVESKINVKLIENSELRSMELDEVLPKVHVVCGDGTDQNLLIEEGLEEVDAFVALTGIDEENIIVSLYAKQIGIPTVISKVHKTNLLDMARTLNIDSVMSPSAISANYVLQYVRAKQNAQGHNVRTLYKIVNGEVEAVEFLATDKCKFLGVSFKELNLKRDLLIASIIRGNKVIIPSGNDCIEQDDIVIVVAKNLILNDLEDILP